MTSSSTAVRIQDLPFNNNVEPLVIQDQLVQKFQKTMKQYPPETENMWKVCKKLRQLCTSSTQYDACAAYVHTIGINVPITSPPDDACISFWQPDQLSRVWVLPASKCNGEDVACSDVGISPSLIFRCASPADPLLPPDGKPSGGTPTVKRQKPVNQVDSIDWGVMSLCRLSRNPLSRFFRLSWHLHHLQF